MRFTSFLFSLLASSAVSGAPAPNKEQYDCVINTAREWQHDIDMWRVQIDAAFRSTAPISLDALKNQTDSLYESADKFYSKITELKGELDQDQQKRLCLDAARLSNDLWGGLYNSEVLSQKAKGWPGAAMLYFKLQSGDAHTVVALQEVLKHAKCSEGQVDIRSLKQEWEVAMNYWQAL